MTVYVVHEIKEDITPAKRFGAIRYVNQFYIHGDELERSPDEKNTIPRGYLANMQRCLADFNPGADYLLIAGDHLQLLALTALLIGKFGYLDVLRWDRQLRDYIPVRLSSGIVPPRATVLSSGTDIGETEHGESRNQDLDQAIRQDREFVANVIRGQILDAPLVRPGKPPAEDDH